MSMTMECSCCPRRLGTRVRVCDSVHSATPDDRCWTSMGGIGKSRLALELARAIERDYTVAFVPLSAMVEADRALRTVADHIGARADGQRPPVDVLVDQLRGRRTVLVLDNVELDLADRTRGCSYSRRVRSSSLARHARSSATRCRQNWGPCRLQLKSDRVAQSRARP